MNDSKVLGDLQHVLVVKQRVEARLICKEEEQRRTRKTTLYVQMAQIAWIVLLLTVEANVMVSEDDWPVALGHTPHGHMEDAIGSFNVMLLQTIRDSNREVRDLTEIVSMVNKSFE